MEPLTPSETEALVQKVGSKRAFAKLMGIDPEIHLNTVQLVSNWMRRGVPLEIQLRNHEVLSRLRKKHLLKSSKSAA